MRSQLSDYFSGFFVPSPATAFSAQLERFRALNGFDTKDKMKPGDLVKLVVE